MRSYFATICNVTICADSNATGNKVIVTYLSSQYLRRVTNAVLERRPGTQETRVNVETLAMGTHDAPFGIKPVTVRA